MTTCKNGCDAPAKARGLCRRCYDRERRLDPVLLEKFREANRRYFQTEKGQEALQRGYVNYRARKRAAREV